MADDIEVASLNVKIVTDGTKIEQSLAEITRQLKLAQSEFSLTSAKLGAYASAEDTAKLKADSLTKQMELQSKTISLLNSNFEKAHLEVAATAKETQNHELKVNKAQIALANMNNELTKANAVMNQVQVETKSTTTAIAEQVVKVDDLSNRLSDLGTRFKTVGQNMQQAGRYLSIGVTAPIVGIGYEAGKASIDFETAFAGVKKTINATADQFAALRQGVLNMSTVMPAAATAIAEVEATAGQLGIHTDNIESFTKVMINMGVATNLAANDAATDLARIANITQMPQTEFERLGSTIVALGNNMATTESDIVAMDLRLAGAGHTIGITNAQTLGFSAALSSVGIEAEAGGSSVSKVMISIANAVASGGKQLNGLASVAGMTGAQFQQSFKTDAAGAIVTFIEGLGKMEKSGQNVFAVLDNLGLSETRTRDALLRAAGAGDLFRKSLDIANTSWEQNTALQKEAAQRYATTQSQLLILKNQLTEIAIKLGDALIPAFMNALKAMQPVFDAVKSGVNWFAKLPEPIKDLTIIFAGLTAVAGPLLIALGMVASGIGAITIAYAGFDIATGGLAFAIGLLVSSLVYLGVELIDLAKHWDVVKIKMADSFDSLGYHIKTVMNNITLSILEGVSNIIKYLSKFADFIPGLNTKINSWREILASAIDGVKANQQADDTARAYNKIANAAEIAGGKVKAAFDFKTAGQPADNSPFPLTPYAKFALGLGGYKPATTPAATTDDGGGDTSGKKTPEQLRKEAYDAALATAKFNAEFLNQSVAQQIAALNQVAAAHKQHLKEDIDDERAMQLDIKKLNEDGVKQGQDAITAKFNASKEWISNQKDLNQLSAADEISAWKRVASQYKDGSAEKIEADKNYYSLKAAMDKQAAADKLAADKQAQQDEIKSLNDFGSAIETALKAQYADEQRIAEEANQKSVDEAQTASQNRMDIYQQEHDQRITLLDDTTNAQVAALQAQMNAIDAQTKAEDAATKEQQYQAQLAADQVKINAIDNSKEIADAKQKLIDATQQQQFRTIDAQAEYAESVKNNPDDQVEAQRILDQKLLGLSQDVATAQSQLNAQTTADNTDKAAAQKDLADLVAQHDREVLLAQRDAQKAALQQQITAIQTAEQVAKTSIDNELKAKQTAETASLKATTDRLASEKTAIDEHYAALTTADALAAAARKLALDKDQTELIALLGTYNPQWQNAGQSFGDSLLAGLNSTKASIQTAVNNILSIVNSAPKNLNASGLPVIPMTQAVKDAELAGTNTSKGLANGLSIGATAVSVAAKGLTTGLIGAMNFALGIHSPSKVTTEIGEFTGKGLVNGLGNTLTNIKQMAAKVATAAIPQTNSMGGIAVSGGSSGGGGGQQNYYSYGDVYINAKDLAEVKSVSDLFNKLKQAARAK